MIENIYKYDDDQEESSDDVERTLILYNGSYFGMCNGEKMKNLLIKARRDGSIYRGTSIVIDNGVLYVYTDGARPIRPLLTVDPVTCELMIDKVSREKKTDLYDPTKHNFTEDDFADGIHCHDHAINKLKNEFNQALSEIY